MILPAVAQGGRPLRGRPAALLVTAIAVARFDGWVARAAGWCFLAGILVFSGSLYALALTGVRTLGAITPLGGLAFLAGWALLAYLAVAGGAR